MLVYQILITIITTSKPLILCIYTYTTPTSLITIHHHPHLTHYYFTLHVHTYSVHTQLRTNLSPYPKNTCVASYIYAIRDMLCLTLVIAEVPGVLEDLEPRPCSQTLLPFGRQVWALPGEETALYREYKSVK